MDAAAIQLQVEELGEEINRVVRELVRNSPVAQNLMGQQAALQRLLNPPASSNGQAVTEEQVLEEVE